MFQRHEYHKERDDGNSKYYVSESDRNRSSGSDDRANVSRDLLMIGMGRDSSYSGPDKAINYRTSYNQDRDGNYYSGSRDYSKDGGSVEFSRTSTQVRDSDYQPSRGSSYGGAVYSGSVVSPYGGQSYNRSSDQDGNRYSSSYSSYDKSGARNQDNQYSSGSAGVSAGGAAYSSSGYGGNQSYSRQYDSRNQDDNRYSSDRSSSSAQPVYYKQETKTYYNDDSQRPSSGQNYSSNYSSNYDQQRPSSQQNYSSNYSSSRDQNRDSDYNSSRGYSGQYGSSGAQVQYGSSSRY